MAETHGSNEKTHISAIESINLKTEQAREAAAEEHTLTAWQAIRKNKRVVLWCIFFAFSCIGWCVSRAQRFLDVLLTKIQQGLRCSTQWRHGLCSTVQGDLRLSECPLLPACHAYVECSYQFEDEWVIPAPWLSGFNSISSVGQFFGGFACSWLSDRVGRKLSLLAGLVLVTGGASGEVFSFTRPAFLIGKLVLGVGLGFFLTIGPLYTSEVAPVLLRGPVVGGINFAIVIGQLLSNAVIKGFGGKDDTWAYRGPFALQFLFVGML
jgi:Sugar (and other) transporter